MDIVFIGFIVIAGLDLVVALLAYQVGRWVERRDAEAKMLRAQVEELKTLIEGADFKALVALRAYQASENETERARTLMGAKK